MPSEESPKTPTRAMLQAGTKHEHTEVHMAGGFTKDGAIQEQIDATIDDAVKQVRRRLPKGESRSTCSICGDSIPEKRRKAIPGVHLCISCQQEEDAQQKIEVGYNRRGSKGSQMR